MSNRPFAFLPTALVAASFLLIACSENGSTSADSGQESKDQVKESQYPCPEALEGVIAYLNKEQVAYICQDEYWVDYNDPETLSRFREMPACTSDDKVAVAIERTNRFTVVCHDRDWFFKKD